MNPRPIAALFVENEPRRNMPNRRSIYYEHEGVDCYDRERDALTWPGGCPVIAHPPCRTWGVLKHLANAPEGEKELSLWAVEQVRRWGGVLEHPVQSDLWKACGIPPPGQRALGDPGETILIDQVEWGHRCQKPTILYLVGGDRSLIHPTKPGAQPTRGYGGPGTNVAADRVAAGIRVSPSHHLPKENASRIQRTPPDLAEQLIQYARSARR